MTSKAGTILKITAARVEDGFTAFLSAENEVTECNWVVKDSKGNIIVNGKEYPNSTQFSFFSAFEGKLWSVESPNLYTLTVVNKFSDFTETITDRFGFRYFDTDEKYIYLNGFPFYMRAYIRGCAAHEHMNNCNLSEYEYYRKNISIAKKYGFNTIRFHSTIPSEECFRAADELGILIHIETRAEKSDYDNIQEMRFGFEDFITDEEIEKIINSLYNHPSFMVYCVGNEIRRPGRNERIKEIRNFIKKNDPTRLFIDTCAHGEYDRDNVDFDVQHMGYYFPYGKHINMFSNTDNLTCFGSIRDNEMVSSSNGATLRRNIIFKRPLIAHEVCHYTAWRNVYTLKEKFKNNNIEVPWWIDEEIKMIEAKGYKDNFGQMLKISKDFQFRCWKSAIESIRRSPILSGFHMLQFADTDKYENSNGIVDCFDEYQGTSEKDFSAFNSDTVILADLEKQVFCVGDKIKIPVILSQYKIDPPEQGTFSYYLKEGEKELLSGQLGQIDTGITGVSKICTLELEVPACNKNCKLTLEFRVEFKDKTICENSWNIWIYKELDKFWKISAKSVMRNHNFDDILSFNDNDKTVVTDELDDNLFEMLDTGKNVVLIYRTDWTRHLLHKDMEQPMYSFRHVWDRFKPVIWDRGTMNGGYDDKEVLNKYGFVTDGYVDYQYYNLIDDSDKINLDDFPIKVKSLVSGLDKSSRDRFDPQIFGLPELMYDRTMRNFSHMFEMNVGKGKLLVTGFNFKKIKDDPSVRAMFNAIMEYVNSNDFCPQSSIETKELKEYLEKVANEGPQKERMMSQYWQLDDAPVESLEYWEESEKYLKESSF